MNTDGPSASDPVLRPAIEPGLLRRRRPYGYWSRAFRRQPWATIGMVALPLPAALLTRVLIERVLHRDLPSWVYTPLMFFLFWWLRARVRTRADAADEAEGVHLGRLPVDVRGSAPVLPSFGPGSPTARHLGRETAAVALLLGGPGIVILAVAIASTPRHPNAVAVGLGAALIAAVPVIVAAIKGHHRRRTTAFLARSLEPTPVRVVGLTTDGLRWAVEPMDGGPRSYLSLHAADDLLVAGDVVHAWGDLVSDPTVGTGSRRLALTGSFGTLWAASVRDHNAVDGRLPADNPDPPSRLTEPLVEKPVVPGAGRLRPVRRADGTLVRPRRTSPPR